MRKKNRGEIKMTEKIYDSELANYVDVCFSCKSQNIILLNYEDDGRESFCNNCKSEDVGAVPPEEVLE